MTEYKLIGDNYFQQKFARTLNMYSLQLIGIFTYFKTTSDFKQMENGCVT